MNASELDRRIEIETPEQVAFSYSVAGIPSRAAALLIDYIICFIPGLLLFAAVVATSVSLRKLAEHASWMMALLILAQFAVFWGYHVLFEGLNDGQTPGKKRMGLRVVQDGGYGVTLGAAAVRNITRLIDMQPGLFHAVAVISAAVSSQGKRLGDMLAGTIVVQERLIEIAPAVAPAPETGVEALLTEDEFALLEQWIARRQSLDPERRRVLADSLAARFADRIPEELPRGAMALLAKLHEREQAARARGAAARGATGAARERHRLIAQGQPRWGAFATLVARAKKQGLSTFSESELADFAARYRELASDLARLRTASQGGESSSLFALGRLVAAGHNVLYRPRRPSGMAALEFIGLGIPREIRRSGMAVGLSALMLFAPMAAAYLAISRQPDLALDVLPAGMLDRAEEAVNRARVDAGYVDIGEAMRPIAASAIIANNIQVSFGAFAFGLTAGIGTTILLVVNGASIGAVLGLYESKGVLPVILSFVAPHGVLELSAIAIAGGAGLLVASAILIPGAMSRREALVVRGRRAITLIAGTVTLLVVAGAIEGLYSPSSWPLEAKLFVSLLTALALLLWLTRGRRATARPAP